MIMLYLARMVSFDSALSNSSSPKRAFGRCLLGLAFCLLSNPTVVSACDVDNPPRLFGGAFAPPVIGPGHHLKLGVQNGYLPGIPVLVRVELRNSAGLRDWSVWDSVATLSTDKPGITLSTNKITLRNGLGTALVTFAGGADFSLTAGIGALQTNRPLTSLLGMPTNIVAGLLTPLNTNWSGIMLVTNDVTVPTNLTLFIQPNTLVLINGVASGTVAPDLLITGAIQSLGTEQLPVTITCAQPNLNWGQIRHNAAQPSLYRYTSINKAGRGPGEGHTATAPMIRPTNSRVSFESCNLTDMTIPAPLPATPGTNMIGKAMQAAGSDIILDDCVIARCRSGPEVDQTGLLATNTYIMEMFGRDDADGIYIHAAAGKSIKLTGCVVAFGDDDGIDTLGPVITIENCIVRDYCDKSISVLDGDTSIDKCLIVDSTHGVSAKSQSSGTVIPIGINRTTIAVATNGIGVINKSGNELNVKGIYNVTNSIIRGLYSVVTDYSPTNFHLSYCNVSPSFSGVSNTPANNAALAALILAGPGISTNSPLFADQLGNDYHLQPGSPCIDAGDPASALDPDGSRIDVGFYTFCPPPPSFGTSEMAPGGYQFEFSAYTNRNWVIESTTDFNLWSTVTNHFQSNDPSLLTDTAATNRGVRFYRAHLAP
jgi:hypothetical protein